MKKEYCGLIGVHSHKESAKLAYLGLYALQHRGEESAGIVSSDGKKIFQHKGMGLVSDVFDESRLKKLKGRIAIGHVRYSTTGSSTVKNVQPFLINYRKGSIAIAHNGNLTNSSQIKNDLERSGSILQTTMDTELIMHLLARSRSGDFEKSLIESISKIEGAYSLVMMTKNELIAIRDPLGFRPLCIGTLEDTYIVASETCALDLMHAKYLRDVEPGEIVFMDKNGLRSIKPFGKKERRAFCIFEYIYFARPDSNIFTKNVYLTRKRLGRQLATEHPVNADLVMPIPDSGVFAALGYAEESKLKLEMGMIRNHYIGRTFIQPSQHTRDFRVKVKLNPIAEVLKGKRVVVVEDSIVRGTTSKNRIMTLREAGAKEVHMRISCPPLKYPCFWGIDFPTSKELIASSRSIDDIRKFIGADSLKYLSKKGMLKAMLIDKKNFCTACFDGDFPTTVRRGTSKTSLEKFAAQER